MQRSPGGGLRLALTVVITFMNWQSVVLLECAEHEYQTEEGQCAPCAQCPPGKEANKICGFGKGRGMTCKTCATGTFSPIPGAGPCLPHTQCETQKRVLVHPGTATTDNQCGDCVLGYYAPAGDAAGCLPCSSATTDTAGCAGLRAVPEQPPKAAKAIMKRETKVALNGTNGSGGLEDSGTEYAVLAIVPVFCLMGLLGILLCNLLKKKGYHCTAQKQLDEESSLSDEKAGDPLANQDVSSPDRTRLANNAAYGVEDANEDTIGVLVRLIAEKQENAIALEELLKDYQSKQIVTTNTSSSKPPSKLLLNPQIPHICKHQHHLHTVQGMASRTGSCCTRCNQKKWPEVLLSPETAAAMAVIPAKPPKAAAKTRRPGETILSVGRFRVARIPEQRPSQNITEVKTISESSCHETTDATPSLPAEQKTLLGNGVKTKWLKPADSKQEDSLHLISAGEKHLVL